MLTIKKGKGFWKIKIRRMMSHPQKFSDINKILRIFVAEYLHLQILPRQIQIQGPLQFGVGAIYRNETFPSDWHLKSLVFAAQNLTS